MSKVPAAAWSRRRSSAGRSSVLPLYALIGEAQLGFEPQAVSHDVRLQGLQLTGDRIGVGLLLDETRA